MSRSKTTAALAIARSGSTDHGTVIDLVHLPRGTRPTPIAYLDYEEIPRCRIVDCAEYQECLRFAADQRWRSFHCRQCPRYRGNHQKVEAKPGDATSDQLAVVIPLH